MITEDQLEKLAITWFQEEGYENHHGPDLNPEPDGTGQRSRLDEVLMIAPLRSAIQRINPQLPASAIEDVLHQIRTLSEPIQVKANQHFHSWLRNGISVSYKQNGELVEDKVFLIDFQNPVDNTFWVVDQLTIKGIKDNRRPDLIVYVNGLPLAIIELKNPKKEDDDGLEEAFHQLQTYKSELPDLAMFNEALIASDGVLARVGSLTASREWFLPWRAVKNEEDRPVFEYELKNVVKGFFDRSLFLEYIRDFVLFESDGPTTIKKIAGYHQFHGVREAVEAAVKGASEYASQKVKGRGGVIWHTQGSGKSISMCCLAGKLLRHPALANPTLVVVTDRNDLDGQLYETFCKAGDLLSDTPIQVDDRKDLRKALNERKSGGIIFTTIQKFALDDDETKFPALSDRHNIVVIADECHRSQYGFKAKLDKKRKAFVAGFAQHMRDALPNATFTGFTGTPISQEDKDTRAVFGDYVSIYDIEQAQTDGATVKIFYESRLAKLNLNRDEMPVIDDEMDELTEDEEIQQAEKTKGKWAALAKLVGADPRLNQVSEDLVKHFETRLETTEGKAVIVCMSREICVNMFDKIVALRPEWAGTKTEHGYDPADGSIRIVMTANASDSQAIQRHHYSKQQKKGLERRFKDPDDSLKLVIVRDMWLTGFDAPCAHTMYIDKPMQGHNLMQAIARVNRVFKGKPGGLIVDYIGIASELKNALYAYTRNGGRDGQPTIDVQEAIWVLKEKLQILRDMFHDFDYSTYKTRAVELLPSAADHVVAKEERKKHFFDTVNAMNSAQALCGTLDEAIILRDEITFFQAIKIFINKAMARTGKKTKQEKEAVLNQLLARAVVPEGVDDIFALAGLDKPDISILSEEFLDDVRNMKHRNLAVELLERLLADEIKARFRRNQTQQKKFSERLEESLFKYRNRAIETSQVIEELIRMAKDFNEAISRGDKIGLAPNELAFYDALEENESAVRELGDDVLKKIAKELTSKLRKSATVDWQHKKKVRARMRIMVKKILKRYKYPPDAEKQAIDDVLKQAESLADEWSEAA
jgi:type I restriction enzyme R subunit